MALADSQIPAAPWTLSGDAIVALKSVPRELARRLVPADAKVVHVLPGRTLAILFIARYLQSPVGEYRELIVSPGLIWRNGRLGFWISHIFVDSAASQVAGRRIWALPKEMASMEWGPERVAVTGPLLSLQARVGSLGTSIRLPFFGAAMSRCDSEERCFAVRGAARVGTSRVTIASIDELGIAELAFSGATRVFVCSDMRVTIGRPSK